jgi:glucokinase
MILAGDIGGTKTNLALFEEGADGQLAQIELRSFPSQDYEGLERVVAEFIRGRKLPLRAACFGVAGPVIGGVSRTPNLPWEVSAKSLASSLHLENVRVINDLEATAYGVPALNRDQLVVLNQGEEKGSGGNIAIIAAGTGLGEAALVWDGAHYHAMASEGGHADFAPRNELEMDLLRYLLTLKKRVSYERVLSGPGLVNIYNFLKARGHAEEPSWLKEAILASDDPAPIISETALAGKASICVKALDMFAAVYGAQAGNLALVFKATGGVYVGGGIAPKIVDKLTDGTFVAAYMDKGRLSPMVIAAPVYVIMNPKTALIGAVHYAASLLTR